MGTWGLDRFLDALERRVSKLPPLPTPEERDAGLILTVRHPGSGTEDAVAEWNQQAPITSDPEDPGLHITIHFEPWENAIIESQDVEPTLAVASPPAAPPPEEPRPLRLLVPGRVWLCSRCDFQWAFEGGCELLGPCPKCGALWAWKAAPTHGGGATITW